MAAKSEADHYARELKREQDEIIAVPDTGGLCGGFFFNNFIQIDKKSNFL